MTAPPLDQVSRTTIADAVLFLGEYTLISSSDLSKHLSSCQMYSEEVTRRTVARHPDAFLLHSSERELFLLPAPESAKSHSPASWLRLLQRGIAVGKHYRTLERAMVPLRQHGSGLAANAKELASVVVDSCLAQVFKVTLPRDRLRILAAMDSLFTHFPTTLPTLVRPGRYLVRSDTAQLLSPPEGGAATALHRAVSVALFLFNDMLLYAEILIVGTAGGDVTYRYLGHRSLTALEVEPDGAKAASSSDPRSETAHICMFTLRLHHPSSLDGDFGAAPRLHFQATSPALKVAWTADLTATLKTAKQPHNNMERYEGAVIFADVSGFSALGDVLERRERELAASAIEGGLDSLMGTSRATSGPSAAEELAKYLGQEVEKMVERVTAGGGDVIKFAGDCIIAVFPADDYIEVEAKLRALAAAAGGEQSPKTKAKKGPGGGMSCWASSRQRAAQHIAAAADGNPFKRAHTLSTLALAAGQAARVSFEMAQAQNETVAKAGELEFDDEVSELIAKLNIHVAIGAGMIYGYHVGGGGNPAKWEYLIDGPVMGQVRSADEDAGPGEVALSTEAYHLLKNVNMKVVKLASGNVRLEAYFGPSEEPDFQRPWEALAGKPEQERLLADMLQLYVAAPVVEQVEAGLLKLPRAHKRLSTMFCRLIGIDYDEADGEVAVVELGAITSQIQLILERHEGTLTRVISDDKGTSMLIYFTEPHRAIAAGLKIRESMVSIACAPARAKGRFTTAMGITTGDVWVGCVGGTIRGEYTMHGSLVNFAARLMCCPLIKYAGGVLVDMQTMEECTENQDDHGHASEQGLLRCKGLSAVVFEPQEPQKFKGFKDPYVSYMPVHREATLPKTVVRGAFHATDSAFRRAQAEQQRWAAMLAPDVSSVSPGSPCTLRMQAVVVDVPIQAVSEEEEAQEEGGDGTLAKLDRLTVLDMAVETVRKYSSVAGAKRGVDRLCVPLGALVLAQRLELEAMPKSAVFAYARESGVDPAAMADIDPESKAEAIQLVLKQPALTARLEAELTTAFAELRRPAAAGWDYVCIVEGLDHLVGAHSGCWELVAALARERPPRMALLVLPLDLELCGADAPPQLTALQEEAYVGKYRPARIGDDHVDSDGQAAAPGTPTTRRLRRATTKAVGKPQRTSSARIGIDKVYTLKVAAVVAEATRRLAPKSTVSAGDSTGGGSTGPDFSGRMGGGLYFSEALVAAVHPQVASGNWPRERVAEHLSFFVNEPAEDPPLGLVPAAEAGGAGQVYVFEVGPVVVALLLRVRLYLHACTPSSILHVHLLT
jgi:class 3 adenylate cyclase